MAAPAKERQLSPRRAATGGDSPAGTQRVLRYPDLGATVYPYRVPRELAEELPTLYGSVLSTLDWFLAWDCRLPTGVCVLDDPRHVVLFRIEGATIEVLNKVFEMAPNDAARLCRALFRALPLTLRIHVDAMFPPYELGLSHRRLLNLDYLMLDLPGSVAAYDESLGKSARHWIRRGTNRLRHDHPDVSTEVVTTGQGAERLVRQVADWKVARFRQQHRAAYWETENDRIARTAALVARCGQAHVTTIDDRTAAIVLVCRAGDGVLFTEVGFDPAYERYQLGFLAVYWSIRVAVAEGARRGNLHVGTSDFKMRLGARRAPVVTLSVFRSTLWRPLYAGEAARLLWSRRATYLWGARFAARWAAKCVRRPSIHHRTHSMV
jgi:CelD/BcsL family acetyltransferase involved in cellulose biosynthesis